MTPCLLGIDFGTGGAKAALVDLEGVVRGYAFEEYPSLHPHPGWSEHDPGVYMASRHTADPAMPGPKRRGPHGYSRAGRFFRAAVPGDGGPGRSSLGNAYNLMDRRARAEVQWLKETIGEARLFEISKNRLDDHPALVNLLWEKRQRPELFARIHKSLTIDGYVNFKLTGRAGAHYSGAAFWGVAYNLLERRFELDILQQIGIPPEILPELFPCTAIIGEVTAAAAAETGLAAGTPVAAGQVDCNASWIGAGAIQPGDIQMNLGTCGNFGIIHQDTHFLETMTRICLHHGFRTHLHHGSHHDHRGPVDPVYARCLLPGRQRIRPIGRAGDLRSDEPRGRAGASGV